jgi:hypothetical protein
MKFDKPIRDMQYFSEGESRRMFGQASPIRIAFDLHLIQHPDIPLETQNYVKSLVDYAGERFQKALSVQPIIGNLLISRECSPADGCSEKCNDVDIPQNHLRALTTWTASGEVTVIPAGSGIPADLLIYVTYSTTECVGATIAFSKVCRLGQIDRPYAGTINFCPQEVNQTADPLIIESHRATTIHEITHVLGFSSTLFSLFRDENGVPRTPRCPNATGCSTTDTPGYPPIDPFTERPAISDSTVLLSSRRGATISYLVTPAVQRVAREYFACPDVPGAEIENEGGPGSASSHFDLRVLLNEMMTPIDTSTIGYPAVLSNFTLAVLEDSGWYTVDYAAADSDPALEFGRGLGCGFLDTDCSAAGFPYCLPGQGSRASCSFDQAGIGNCAEDVRFMDGCSITIFSEELRCDNATGVTPAVLDPCPGQVDCAGSAPGPGSACFASTVILIPESGVAPEPLCRTRG